MPLALALAVVAGCQCPGPNVSPGDDAGTDGGLSSDGGADGGDAGTGGPGTDGGGSDGGSGTDGGSGADGGGGADGGACAPQYTGNGTQLASSLQVPRRLAVDDQFVYATEAGIASNMDGKVTRMPRNGAGSPSPIATGLASPDAIAIDATHAFVVSQQGILRVPKGGGAAEVLAFRQADAEFGGTEVRLTDTQVVVATGLKWLFKMNKDGTGVVDLFTGADGERVVGLALENGQAFFLVTGGPDAGLWRVPLDQPSARTRLRLDPSQGTSLLLTPTHFIWTEGRLGNGKVRRAPRGGGASEELATGLTEPARLALAGETLYFKDRVSGSTGFFRYVSLCAPGQSPVVGPTGDGPGDVIFDPSGLYFSSQAASPNGAVRRFP